MPQYWLLKSEPETHILTGTDGKKHDVSYPFERLEREKVGPFFGVRNYQARNNLRDKMKVGDLVLYYHSSCKVPGIPGIAEVVREGYPDIDATTPGHPFFDPKARLQDDPPRWVRVDLKFIRTFDNYVPLTSLRGDPVLESTNMVLLRQSRLSVQPVTEEQWNRILLLSGGSSGGSSSSNSSNSSSATGAGSGESSVAKKAGSSSGKTAKPSVMKVKADVTVGDTQKTTNKKRRKNEAPQEDEKENGVKKELKKPKNKK